MKSLFVLAGLVLAAYLAGGGHLGDIGRGSGGPAPGGDTASVAQALAERASGTQVSGSGIVIKLLPDDDEGSRHQRFILRLASGQTLLIAHNIDLAPRIGTLRSGDEVSFRGDYEWNAKGGVVHWTHRDPGGRHPPGWLEHGGRIYQ